MIEFLKSGTTLDNVKMGMTKQEVISILGQPSEVIDQKDFGYIFYNQNRYALRNDVVNEISIEFNLIQKPYIFKDIEFSQFGISIKESFKIDSNSKINEVISFINHLNLDWEAKSSNDKSNLTLKIKNGPFIVFDLYSGTVFKISVVNGFQNKNLP